MKKEDKLYRNLSIYVPKYEGNFMKVCEHFVKKEFEDQSFSQFLLTCVKTYINGMPRELKKKFEACAYDLAKKDKPKSTEFVDKFMGGTL